MTKWLPPGKGGYTARSVAAAKKTAASPRPGQSATSANGRFVTKASSRRLPPPSAGGATRAR
jgi:hypothetical protein